MSTLNGIDKLRQMRLLFGNCKESFNQSFTLSQLENIFDAYKRSDFEITPDDWTEGELASALLGNGSGATGAYVCPGCRNVRTEAGTHCSECAAEMSDGCGDENCDEC